MNPNPFAVNSFSALFGGLNLQNTFMFYDSLLLLNS